VCALPLDIIGSGKWKLFNAFLSLFYLIVKLEELSKGYDILNSKHTKINPLALGDPLQQPHYVTFVQALNNLTYPSETDLLLFRGWGRCFMVAGQKCGTIISAYVF
jgi:hypothetical protein